MKRSLYPSPWARHGVMIAMLFAAFITVAVVGFMLFILISAFVDETEKRRNSFPEEQVLRVAVAANFTNTLKELIPAFESSCQCRVDRVSGSSGKLYAQIQQGLPVDIFLSADAQRPKLLEDENLIIPSSRQTYARGILVLWSPKYDEVKQQLQTNELSNLAMANPKLAPYGLAAQQVLNALQYWQAMQGKLLLAENLNQVMHQVQSGADAGFLSLAQVRHWHKSGASQQTLNYWRVPDRYYSPIIQQMVALKASHKQQLINQFQQYLLSPMCKVSYPLWATVVFVVRIAKLTNG